DTFLVALTGYGQPSDRTHALESGFDEHVVKPVHPDLLLRILGRDAPQQREVDGHHAVDGQRGQVDGHLDGHPPGRSSDADGSAS
ncbi:MAG TPA: hypothetical protein VM925_37275, partial [Labilithrix sp.]|nr:hypothetical protein [Labilithrix sp.]